MEHNFRLALRLGWCKPGKGPGGAFSTQSILRNPARPRGAQMLCGYFKLEGVDDEGRAHSPCYVRYDKRARPDATAQTRQQAGGSGKAKRAVGCKLVGAVRGTKLWAGDCIGVELLKGTTDTSEQATSVIPPPSKQ